MKIGKWQWHYYLYRKEVLKGLLARIESPVQQRRMLRRRLKALANDSSRCDVTWYTYTTAYIERAAANDPWSYRLEKNAIALLLSRGIVPPKSTLSPLFTALFSARLTSPPPPHCLNRYQLLAHYCNPTFRFNHPPYKLPTLAELKPINTTNGIRPLRRFRLSGQLEDADNLCRTCTNTTVIGEALLIYAQRKNSMPAISATQCERLTIQQCAELHLMTTAIKQRQWLDKALPMPCPTEVVPLYIQLRQCYRFDVPLLQRLYDYVDFKRAHVIDNTLYRLYHSAGCLRWLFRANQTDFARLEAQDYIALSHAVSRGHTHDALGVMGDVLKRLHCV